MVVIYMGYEGVEKLGEALKSSWGGGEGRGGGVLSLSMSDHF